MKVTHIVGNLVRQPEVLRHEPVARREFHGTYFIHTPIATKTNATSAASVDAIPAGTARAGSPSTRSARSPE